MDSSFNPNGFPVAVYDVNNIAYIILGEAQQSLAAPVMALMLSRSTCAPSIYYEFSSDGMTATSSTGGQVCIISLCIRAFQPSYLQYLHSAIGVSDAQL